MASYGREAREPSGVSFIRAQISFLRAPPSCLAYILHVHAQSCRTLFDPVVCSPPGFSVHEILQAGILEWVAISSSRRFSPPRDQTSIFCVSCIAGGFFTTEPPGKPTSQRHHLLIPSHRGFKIWGGGVTVYSESYCGNHRSTKYHLLPVSMSDC